MITNFKLFETINDGVIVYHGGNKLTNDNIKDGGIFTTTDKKSAMWYIYGNTEEGRWLNKMIVKIENPLTIKNKEDFKNNWIPILDEAKVDYTFEEDDNGFGWSFEYIDNDYQKENKLDLVYIKKFIDVAIEHSYDGIIYWDQLTNGQIMVYIPFLKENIKILDSKYFE